MSSRQFSDLLLFLILFGGGSVGLCYAVRAVRRGELVLSNPRGGVLTTNGEMVIRKASNPVFFRLATSGYALFALLILLLSLVPLARLLFPDIVGSI